MTTTTALTSFPYYRLTKRFLLNFLLKQMVNALSCTAELWMHSGDSGWLSSQQLEELRIVY